MLLECEECRGIMHRLPPPVLAIQNIGRTGEERGGGCGWLRWLVYFQEKTRKTNQHFFPLNLHQSGIQQSERNFKLILSPRSPEFFRLCPDPLTPSYFSPVPFPPPSLPPPPGEELRYDRILCDVMCSGDGTLRDPAAASED